MQDVEYVPDEPVHIWIDPGYSEAYACEIVQIINDQIRVIDEIYERDLVTDDMIDIAQSRPWWKDARFGVIDVAGFQHQAMAAPAEVWMNRTGIYFDSQKIRINEGTERLKSFLKTALFLTQSVKVSFLSLEYSRIPSMDKRGHTGGNTIEMGM